MCVWRQLIIELQSLSLALIAKLTTTIQCDLIDCSLSAAYPACWIDIHVECFTGERERISNFKTLTLSLIAPSDILFLLIGHNNGQITLFCISVAMRTNGFTAIDTMTNCLVIIASKYHIWK